jgi:hypothetical protein
VNGRSEKSGREEVRFRMIGIAHAFWLAGIRFSQTVSSISQMKWSALAHLPLFHHRESRLQQAFSHHPQPENSPPLNGERERQTRVGDDARVLTYSPPRPPSSQYDSDVVLDSQSPCSPSLESNPAASQSSSVVEPSTDRDVGLDAETQSIRGLEEIECLLNDISSSLDWGWNLNDPGGNLSGGSSPITKRWKRRTRMVYLCHACSNRQAAN